MQTFLTPGEFARLASTTKRTIIFYDQIGILKPYKVNSSKYRYYQDRQILDFQKIHLLSSLGVSLAEMKKYLRKNGNLTKLFDEKKTLIENNIKMLEFNLKNIGMFQKNLDANGTMVDPEIKIVAPFEVYYIEKIGAYAKIGKYCDELLQMFEFKAFHAVTMTIFEDSGYFPKKSRMKICVLKIPELQVKNIYQDIVKTMNFSPGKVITYTHNGSGNIVSLFWKELEKYCLLHAIKVRKNMPDFEIYRNVDQNPIEQFFEIYLPII